MVDKLGVKPGHAVALVGASDPHLQARILERTGREPAAPDEPADVVLVWTDASTDAVSTLRHWKPKIEPNGGIWLLTPKRTQPGYVDQAELIAAGKQAGVVDNKICSVSETTSAMRFVIRKADRPRTVY